MQEDTSGPSDQHDGQGLRSNTIDHLTTAAKDVLGDSRAVKSSSVTGPLFSTSTSAEANGLPPSLSRSCVNRPGCPA